MELKSCGKWANDGSQEAAKLPDADVNGNPIAYKEYDVDPRPTDPNVRRGKERIITGSDGSAYYTDDHYLSFKPIR